MGTLKYHNGIEWVEIPIAKGDTGTAGPTGPQGPEGPAGTGVPDPTAEPDGRVIEVLGGAFVFADPSGSGDFAASGVFAVGDLVQVSSVSPLTLVAAPDNFVGTSTTPITDKATARPNFNGTVFWFTDFSLVGGGIPTNMADQDVQVRVDEAS